MPHRRLARLDERLDVIQLASLPLVVIVLAVLDALGASGDLLGGVVTVSFVVFIVLPWLYRA